ncbi:MAG: preprotein translocase subunit YajC [Acidobacteriaceae bacterium]|nr:preprotein translocase subunit YajC [Acidobacteriaceae bacterium]
MLAIWFVGSPFGNLGGLPLLVLFIIAMWFLLIVPNQKKQKRWQEMLSKLKSGDRVTTNGGIRGTVLVVKDDSVVLRVQPDGVKLEFVKGAIATVTTDEQESK